VLDRALERDDQRDLEEGEEPDEILRIGGELGTLALVHLRQEEPLEVDQRATASLGLNPFRRSHCHAGIQKTVCAKNDIIC
jgi:hypothetical protein